MTSNLTYWEKRFLRIEADRDKREQAYLAEMNKRYGDLAQRLQKEVDDWVQKYAVNDNITAFEANQLLSKSEQKTWSMSLESFKQKAIEGGFDQELNREYYRSRISRLQQLQHQLVLELAEHASYEIDELEAYLVETFDETYLRNIYEIADRGAINLTFQSYSPQQLALAVRQPWTGDDFSRRVWRNHLEYLPDKLNKSMANAIAQGWGTDRIVNEMMKGVDRNLRNRMITLVQSESAHIAEEASQASYRETGVEQYTWMATFETHTCDQCARLDGQSFDIGDPSSPHPVEDTHPNCRCTTVPKIDYAPAITTRWQRDPVTGKGKVMKVEKFKDWKKRKTKEAA